ncbi:MAG TPA: S8 family serine peptidase [Baekduia sp.]
MPARLLSPRTLVVAVLATVLAPAAAHAKTVSDEVVVGYKGSPRPHVVHTAHVAATIARYQRHGDVRYAVRNAVAHTSGAYMPDDPGRGTTPGRWAAVQWNFAGPAGVDAPDAWGHLIAAGHPGGQGVKIAVLDTGVAYRQFGKTPASPDLAGTRFVQGYDFVGHDPYANDRNGHGTHVTSTIAETTNNGIGLTGLAYGASIMPVKVLDDSGEGDATVIAQGVRYAVKHGAKVINLSLEFSSDIGWRQIPQLIDAISEARAKGVVVVAASGNEADTAVAYPARNGNVLSVGSTTEHACLSDFSNQGPGLDLVAPGGGQDAPLDDPGCDHGGTPGRNIAQMTLIGIHKTKIGIPRGYEGTSMAVPHVSAAAALVIASGVLGPDPSAQAVERRLETTARDLGAPGYDTSYGYGLINAAAATDPAVPVS